MPIFALFDKNFTKPIFPSDEHRLFYSVQIELLLPNKPHLIRTNISTSFSNQNVLLIKNLYESDDNFNKDIRVLAGVIDSDYRGEIKVLVINTGENPIKLKNNLSVARFNILNICTDKFTYQENIESETERGVSGFGSTGK